MAIIRFTFDRDKVPADAANVHEGTERVSHSEPDGTYTDRMVPLWTWHERVGLCLAERERNMYDDSDFFMLVWDPTEKRAYEIEFASTRGWSYPSFGSFVDATPEVRAEYDAWKTEQDRVAREARAARLATQPTQGKRVRVVKVTRGKDAPPAGVEGTIFWTRQRQYAFDTDIDRVGLRTDSGMRYFAPASSVEVVR